MIRHFLHLRSCENSTTNRLRKNRRTGLSFFRCFVENIFSQCKNEVVSGVKTNRTPHRSEVDVLYSLIHQGIFEYNSMERLHGVGASAFLPIKNEFYLLLWTDDFIEHRCHTNLSASEIRIGVFLPHLSLPQVFKVLMPHPDVKRGQIVSMRNRP